jgi:hypothetical protein
MNNLSPAPSATRSFHCMIVYVSCKVKHCITSKHLLELIASTHLSFVQNHSLQFTCTPPCLLCKMDAMASGHTQHTHNIILLYLLVHSPFSILDFSPLRIALHLLMNKSNVHLRFNKQNTECRTKAGKK